MTIWRDWLSTSLVQASVQPNDVAGNRLLGLSLRFWTMVVLTGIGAGLGAGLLMLLLRLVQHLAYSYQSGDFLDGVRHVSHLRRVLLLIGGGVVTAGGILLLRQTPGGSGGKLNERIWFHSGLLAEAKTLAQAVLSIVIVGLGASLGRETAPKQAGAAVASWLSRRFHLSPAESRLLAACGAGAGIGAVYNVPFGGALFALEVLLGTMALPLIPPALATSVIATVVAWLMLPDVATYSIATFPIDPGQIVWAFGFGPIAGLASVLYVRLIVRADSWKPKRSIAPVMPVAVFAALGLLAIPFPQLLGNGKDIAQLAFDGRVGLWLLLTLVILKPLATAACLGSGAPGGLFTPSITFGALLGALLGEAWSAFWPGAMPGSYAIIGAAAILAASMQAPLAAVVLMIELTHHINTMMVPILIAVTGAAVVARRLDPRSIYSGRIHLGKLAAEAELPTICPHYHRLLAKEARTISLAANYPEVLARFVTPAGDPKPLYAIDENGALAGRIDAASIAKIAALPAILSTAAAGDLVSPIEPLNADMSEAEAIARLEREPTGELPVVEGASARLIGVAVRP